MKDDVMYTVFATILCGVVYTVGYIVGEHSLVTECKYFGKFRVNSTIYNCSKEGEK